MTSSETEIQRIAESEILEVAPLVHGEKLLDEEEISGEITSGSTQVMGGALRMGRALEHARIKGTFASALKEHRLDKSQSYALAQSWRVYGAKVLDGWSALEVLTPTHLIRALRAPDPIGTVEYAADNNENVAQMEARIKQVEEEGVEVVETSPECPSCGADSKHWQRIPVEKDAP